MAAIPDSLPRWADVGGEITVPASGKMDVGWEDAELPPHDVFNWHQNLTYQWLLYYQDTRPLIIPLSLFQPYSTAGAPGEYVETRLKGPATAGLSVIAQIPMHVGTRLRNIRARVKDHATNGTYVSMIAYSQTDGAGTGSIGSISSAGDGTTQDITFASAPMLVATDPGHTISVRLLTGTGGGAPSEVSIYSVICDIDIPMS